MPLRQSNCRVLHRNRRFTAFRAIDHSIYDHSWFNIISNLPYSLLAHSCIKTRYFTYSQRSITSIKLKCAKYSLETNQPYRFDAIFPAPFAVFQRLGPARRLYYWTLLSYVQSAIYNYENSSSVVYCTYDKICNMQHNLQYNIQYVREYGPW